jgi:hypothetical protein
MAKCAMLSGMRFRILTYVGIQLNTCRLSLHTVGELCVAGEISGLRRELEDRPKGIKLA